MSNDSPALIAQKWREYGRGYAVHRSLWDGSNVFSSGPLQNEGNTLRDYSGRNPAGAVWSVGAGDVPKYTQGSVRGQAFWAGTYDGINDYCYASIANFAINALRGAICFWFRSSTTATNANIFSSQSESNSDVYLMARLDGGAVEILQNNGASPDSVRTTVATFNDNLWHHAVIVSDGQSYAICVDGVPQSLTVVSGNNSGDWFGDTIGRDNISLGARKRPSDIINYYAGALAGACVYVRTITPNEIATLARDPLESYAVNVPRYYLYATTPAASPWLYARRHNSFIGSGLGA